MGQHCVNHQTSSKLEMRNLHCRFLSVSTSKLESRPGCEWPKDSLSGIGQFSAEKINSLKILNFKIQTSQFVEATDAN